jgi:ribosomal-protein-alanine N-acetyltransferase
MIALERQSSAAGHWSKRQYEDLFRIASDSQHSERHVVVAEEESETSEIVGFLAARRIDAEWELENIAVADKVRRKGLGSRLLGGLISYARSASGAAIFLEVRESNQSARALYLKLGFQETGVRKNYYPNPAEDAILYRLPLKITTISQ